MSESLVLDCLGELCPTPIIQLSKAVRAMNPGERIILKADDPATKSDLMAWARMTGNLVTVINETSFDIKKS
ncbi:MAG: sulfurtransferase TusA family protein [Actinobacteria bacterium]|nr:sulfurtransferase TusA family protein [Actinomycetota bacterium]